jgi:hypothetical protein
MSATTQLAERPASLASAISNDGASVAGELESDALGIGA